MSSIFDIAFSDDRYQAQVMPDLFPNIRQPVLSNWHPEDLPAYCGGQYTKRPVGLKVSN